MFQLPYKRKIGVNEAKQLHGYYLATNLNIPLFTFCYLVQIPASSHQNSSRFHNYGLACMFLGFKGLYINAGSAL